MENKENSDPELESNFESSLTQEPEALERIVPVSPEALIEDLHSLPPEPEQLIKAAIFASPEYVTISSIKEVLGNNWDAAKIKDSIKNINSKLSLENEPFEIVEANNSFCFRTLPKYQPWIKKLFKASSSRKLSQAALEILALVAYKQPITKAELEEVRGVSVDGVLRGLLERKLVTITGRSESIGNALFYGTTKEFLRYFGINRVPHDLPKLSEFEELIDSSALLPQVSKEGSISQPEQDEAEED